MTRPNRAAKKPITEQSAWTLEAHAWQLLRTRSWMVDGVVSASTVRSICYPRFNYQPKERRQYLHLVVERARAIEHSGRAARHIWGNP